MSDPALFRYRVTFPKAGRLAMLSHLELTHAIERMVRRAQLPFAVTQGFSPHMRLGYGAALPVGVGSTCEIFDLFLTEDVPEADVLARLQAASPEALRPTGAERVEYREPAASIAFPYSTYEVVLGAAGSSEGTQSPSGGRLSQESLRIPETIELVRETKIKTFQVADYLVEAPRAMCGEDGSARIKFTLEATQAGSLRPDLFVESLLRENGISCPVLSITRVKQSKAL